MRLLDIMKRKQDARNNTADIMQSFRNALYSSPLCSSYENLFAQLRPFIDEMKMVRPYGVGRNGAKLPTTRTPELAVLDNPNQTMGWCEFADAMYATWLSKPELNIRVWRDTRGHIIAYTLLNGAGKTRRADGTAYWHTSDGIVEEDEVLTLTYSRNPDNLDEGVSPASSVQIWAQIDDCLAQFQRAYFENGAVPAFVTTITASSNEKYNQIRQELERRTKGSDNAHKTIYLWNQYQPETGESKKQVEITPIQGANNTLAIDQLVKVINDRLNKAVGVSNFILGDDSSAKYDNAELSDHQFTKRRIYPALVTFWSQFQHELDRITGGLGYAIQFDLEIPELTERQHTRALIAKENAATLRELIEAGADPVASCEALGLGDSWKTVATGIRIQHRQDRENEEALRAAQLALPETTAEAKQEAKEAEPAQDCHHHHHTDVYVPFSDEEKTERAIFDQLMTLANAIFEENPDLDRQGIIDEIVKLLEDEAENGEEESIRILEKMVDDPEILEKMEATLKAGNLISDDLARRIKNRTEALVLGYDQQTREIMRAVLESSTGYTAEEIRERLQARIPDGKAATIARNETVYAFKSGRLEMDKSAADEYGLKIELTWHTSRDSDVCALCAAMEGKKTILGKAFKPEVVHEGGRDKVWKRSSWNDFGEIPNAHTNCRCYFDERLIKDEEA